MEGDDPWAWMQPYDVRRFGEVILDKKEQERWCRAVLLGGAFAGLLDETDSFVWKGIEIFWGRKPVRAG